ncbi:hypothetical protein NDU88_007193 [Pleurodeles waltl]|uniref:Uncharacterized protein n=1 Tax=Pleurodeles waltl TaxID=8319 RepID=A0AAV7U0S2_PLEWA|nr:hypothetical protein NDU88_007193 [Pleurodeles waltl]
MQLPDPVSRPHPATDPEPQVQNQHTGSSLSIKPSPAAHTAPPTARRRTRPPKDPLARAPPTPTAADARVHLLT